MDLFDRLKMIGGHRCHICVLLLEKNQSCDRVQNMISNGHTLYFIRILEVYYSSRKMQILKQFMMSLALN